MKILFVVQRYGKEIAGGAEQACRSVASGLAARGHHVEVVTSRATSYVDWADDYPAGTSELDGVVVHRLAVKSPRDTARFNALHDRLAATKATLALEEAWMEAQGPVLPGLRPWIAERARDFDVAVFFNYLYWPTWAGLALASALTPTVLVPAAHDEPELDLTLFRLLFPLAHGFVFLTPEEAAIVHRRFRLSRPSCVAGLGVDLVNGDAGAARASLGLGDDPYLLYLGRIDPNKGAPDLFDWFVATKQRRPSPLRLVLAGAGVHPLPTHPDVVQTGFVDDATKLGLLAGAVALAQPSYLESFSLVMAESWAQARPVLAQATSPVVEGQVRRSGGGILYRTFAEFETALHMLTQDSELAARLGRAGREYVERELAWPAVLDRFEALFTRLCR